MTVPAGPAESTRNTPAARPSGTERVFAATVLAALLVELLFVVAVIGALILFTDPASLAKAVASPTARSAIWLTLVTVTLSSALAVVLAVPVAYGLVYWRIPCRAVVDTVVDLPIVMPPIAAGLALLLLFGYYLGDMMRPLGLYLPYTRAGIVLAQFFGTMTFAVRTAKTAFEGVGLRLPAVAGSLGSPPWRVFRRVILPLSRPGLTAGAVLTWARCIGLFGPVVMFCGVTQNRTEVLSTSIYLQNSIGQLEVAAAGTLILVTIALLTLLLLKKLGVRAPLWQ